MEPRQVVAPARVTTSRFVGVGSVRVGPAERGRSRPQPGHPGIQLLQPHDRVPATAIVLAGGGTVALVDLPPVREQAVSASTAGLCRQQQGGSASSIS